MIRLYEMSDALYGLLHTRWMVSGNVAYKELRTVGLGANRSGDITENDIRIEQGLPLRVAY